MPLIWGRERCDWGRMRHRCRSRLRALVRLVGRAIIDRAYDVLDKFLIGWTSIMGIRLWCRRWWRFWGRSWMQLGERIRVQRGMARGRLWRRLWRVGKRDGIDLSSRVLISSAPSSSISLVPSRNRVQLNTDAYGPLARSKLHLSILHTITSAVQHVEPRDDALWAVLLGCRRFLRSTEGEMCRVLRGRCIDVSGFGTQTLCGWF